MSVPLEKPVRWPIRNQILVPFSVVLVVSIAAATFGAAWMASRRVERELAADLERVTSTLGNPQRSSFPLSANVLETMRGLSGAEFVVLDETGSPTVSTIDVDSSVLDAALNGRPKSEWEDLDDLVAVPWKGERYLLVAIARPGRSGQPVTLVTLYPETTLERARREAMLSPLLTGGALLLATILLAAWLAGRTARRIRSVREKVARVADGDFHLVDLDGPDDEIRELSASVNRMAAQLRELQESMRRTERARLLGQLAGGLAHQLRNAVTGARLAVQLHLKRHADEESEGLDVALRQLRLVEEQVRALLSLGREEDRPLVSGTAADVVADVARLVGPNCEHEKVDLEIDVSEELGSAVVDDSEGVRSAVLNLALNAIEAAGPGGRVSLSISLEESRRDVAFEVADSGPGPDESLGESVFEPFVTTKPEGVGLGLALVRAVANRSGGRVTWHRDGSVTRFRLLVPASGMAASVPSR